MHLFIQMFGFLIRHDYFSSRVPLCYYFCLCIDDYIIGKLGDYH